MRKSSMSSYASKAIVFVLVIAPLIGCATIPSSPPPPEEPLVYKFDYEFPNDAVERNAITIGMLNADWSNFSYQLEFAFKEQESSQINASGKTSWSKAPGLREDVARVVNDFNTAMLQGFERILLNRGFTTKGPFTKLADMTYPDKKACNLVVTPTCTFYIQTSDVEHLTDQVSGTAVLRWTLDLAVHEPMSGEKLWQKQIALTSDPFPFKYVYDVEPVYNANFDRVGLTRKGITWDNRAPRLAKAFEKFYPIVMSTCWDYINPDEMAVLKGHSDDIRAQKVF